MSWLSKFLHPEKGYEKAQNELDKYYQQGQGYLDPYNQFGIGAHENLSEIMKALLNPAQLQDEWIKGYTESGAAKNAEDMAMQHGLDAASNLGLNGSNTALNAILAGTSQIGLEDRQHYLDDLMQKYLAGAGIAGNIFGTGANAASQMGQNATNMGQNSAQLAYGKENAKGNLFGNLLGAGSSLVGGALSNYTPKWNFSGRV